MPLQLSPFADIGLSEALLDAMLEEHESNALPTLNRLWTYYRNPATGSGGFAQEAGLPARLRGRSSPLNGGAVDDRSAGAREVVIENDIAWRIHAMVDFMLGRPITIRSHAGSPEKRAEIEAILDAVFEQSGGAALLHDMALLGAVYGHVDLLLRTDELFSTSAAAALAPGADPAEIARFVRIELIEAPRAIPLLDPADFRTLSAMVVRFERRLAAVDAPDAPRPRFSLRRAAQAPATEAPRRATSEIVEIFSARFRQLYENRRLVDEAPNPLGVVPIVHIQNISQPLQFEGLSEVEPLIPLQNELNTRLSDRAHRVTMQSFKMYLAKGLDGVGASGTAPGGAPISIGPGQIWTTENPGASIEAFGGDASSPSEDNHIEQIRQAMDKASSVTPIAAGVIRERIGQLTSENALRVTLMGLLAKIARKQSSYGRGMSDLSRIILHALDLAGVYRTSPADRDVRIEWPDPLPRADRERLDEALMKQSLGVPKETILAELGYAPTRDGVR